MADLAKMSKKQLEAYARKEFDVELDRRHTKKQLLAKVQELSEDQEVEDSLNTVSSREEALDKLRAHIEKHSSERRDCATIWTLIKNNNHSHAEVVNLIKAKGYETLLGEIS